MISIYKYKLRVAGRTTLLLPEGAKILSVQEQFGEICLWAHVDDSKVSHHRVFDIYGTGFQMPADPGDYLATIKMESGALVWHVFESTRVVA